MPRNIGSVVTSINELVAELGLEKLAVSGDPGTSHPAKAEASKGNTQPATEGARSAENVADNKEEVTGQSIAEGKPADAAKEPGKSHVANITTATFVGEAPKVEQGYGTSVKDPGTTHPANATGSTDKAAADLGKCAESIMAELKKIAEVTVTSAKEAREKIASLVEVKPEAKPEEKEAAVDSTVTDYITGYVKSAGLVGELTADMLDGMADAMAKAAQTKKAEGEGGAGAPPPPEAEGATTPSEGGAGGEGLDQEAAALAQAAAEIAAELGCTPEDVLDAAAAELEQGGGAGGAPGAEGGAPAGGPPPGLEAQASAEKDAAAKKELEELREKASAYDKLVAENAVRAAEEKQATVVKTAVTSALDQFMAKKSQEIPAK